MQVNYYANALLALGLLPLLEATGEKWGPPSRLTIVGSEARKMASVANPPIPEHKNVVT